MFLLDTSHTGYLLDNHPKFVQKLIEFGQVPIYTSVITAGEIMYGAFYSQSSERNIPRVRSFLSSIDVLDVDIYCSDIYGQLKSDLFNHLGSRNIEKRKKQNFKDFGISDNDLWIASIAVNKDLILLTSDKKDFSRIKEVIDIQFESWV